MKKLFALALALTLSLALLAGCGEAKAPADPNAGKDATSSEPAKDAKLVILDSAYADEEYAICIAKDNADLLEKVNGALAELKKDGVTDAIVAKYIDEKAHDYKFQENVPADAKELVMATNAAFPPYEYRENDTIVGIDAEMAAAIADKLGMKLRIEDTEFGSIIGGVQTGKYDMGMAGITINPDRQQSVAFTDTYAKGVQAIIVKEGSPITSADVLKDKAATYVVGVQQDTTGDIYSTDDLGDARVMRFNKGADAVQALVTGKVDCVVIDNEPAKSFVESNNK
ncbi:MAG: transporter substrate-binding domain-containing protein [Evtepia sp.]